MIPHRYIIKKFVGMTLAAPMVVSAAREAGETATSAIHIQGRAEATEAPVLPPIISKNAEAAERTMRITVGPTEAQEWTKQQERTFVNLVRKEALETATPAELHELEELSRIRERLKVRLTTKEILSRRRQREIELRLLATLQEYFEFGRHNGRQSQKVEA